MICHFFYTSNASKEIIFEKDTNIFLELKTSAKNSKIDDISVKLLNMANRFSLAYKNPAYSSLNKRFSKDKLCYSLLYDSNRAELVSQMININIPVKDMDVYYNSFNAPISSIVFLQNQINGVKKELNEKVIQLQEQANQNQAQIKEYKELVNSLQEQMKNNQEQMKKNQEKHELEMSIMNLKILNNNFEELK